MAWAPDYVDRDELKAFVRIEDDLDDAQLDLAIAAASRAVDRACGRQFGLSANLEPRYYTAKLDPIGNRMAVEIDDVQELDGLQVHADHDGDDTYAREVTSYTPRPRNALAEGFPYTQLMVGRGASVGFPSDLDAVRVTARFGWSAVPPAVKEATALQASRLVSRRDAPFGVAGSPAMGSEVRLLAKLDPDVEVALRPYRRFQVVLA